MWDKKKDTCISIRIPSELLNKLQYLADKDDRTLAAFVRLRLIDICENVEEKKFAEKEERIKAIAAKIQPKLKFILPPKN